MNEWMDVGKKHMIQRMKDSHEFRKTSEAPPVSLPLSSVQATGQALNGPSQSLFRYMPAAISLFQPLPCRCKAP